MKKLLSFFLLSTLTLTTLNLSYAQVSDADDADELECTTLSYNMRLGSRDQSTNGDVSKLQVFLSQANYLDSDPTGYYGNATRKAVRSFQQDNRLIVTGTIGAMSRAKIKSLSCVGTNNPLTPVTQNPTNPSSVACTMEMRYCANGEAMQRDLSTCRWKSELCKIVNVNSEIVLSHNYTGKDMFVGKYYTIAWSGGDGQARELHMQFVSLEGVNNYYLGSQNLSAESRSGYLGFNVPPEVKTGNYMLKVGKSRNFTSYEAMSKIFWISGNDQSLPVVTSLDIQDNNTLVIFGENFSSTGGYYVGYKFDCDPNRVANCGGKLTNQSSYASNKITFTLDSNIINNAQGHISFQLLDKNGKELSGAMIDHLKSTNSTNKFSLKAPTDVERGNVITTIKAGQYMNICWDKPYNFTDQLISFSLIDSQVKGGSNVTLGGAYLSHNCYVAIVPSNFSAGVTNVVATNADNSLYSNSPSFEVLGQTLSPVTSTFNFLNSGSLNSVAHTYQYTINNYRNGLVMDVEVKVDCPTYPEATYKMDCSKYIFNLGTKGGQVYNYVLADPYVKGGTSYRFTDPSHQIDITGYPVPGYTPIAPYIAPVPSSIEYKFILRDINNGGIPLWSETKTYNFKG